jgi:menaquinone-dependent protoporphyrinogen IX oxidase
MSREIAEAIAKLLRQRGIQVDVVLVEEMVFIIREVVIDHSIVEDE